MLLVKAQEADTVYVHEPPVVIRKQIVMHEAKVPLLMPETWFVVLGLGHGSFTNNQPKDSIQKTMRSYFSPYVQIGRKLGENFNLSVGLGKLTSYIDFSYNQNKSKIVDVNKQRYDTVGAYTIILPTGVYTYYTIDTIPYISKERQLYDSTIMNRERLSYWSIPLQLGYQLKYKKVFAEPFVALVYNIGTKSQVLVPEKNLTIPKTFISTSLGANVGCQLDKHVSVELGYGYNAQLTKRSSYIHMTSSVLKFQIKYLF